MGITPIQTGTGDPYPAGGGKNKYGPPSSATTSGGVTLTPNADGSVTLAGSANSSAALWWCPVDIPANTAVTFSLNNTDTNAEIGIRLTSTPAGGAGTTYGTGVFVNATNKTGTVTETFAAKGINLFVKSNHGAVASITLKIQCELGSTATAWAPYENIRPISGWTGARVTVAGKNLLEDNAETSRSANITMTRNADGSLTLNGTLSSPAIVIYNFATDATFSNQNDMKRHLPKGTLYYSTGNASDNIQLQLCGSNHDDNAHTTVTASGKSGTFTNAYYWKYYWVRLYLAAGTYTNEVVKPFICLNSEADKTFVKSTVNVYSVDWTDEAGTVYGGSLDATLGKLIVTDANIASYNGETLPSTWICDRAVYAAGTTPPTGSQVVYKLATPLEYDLTPTDIQLLVGKNNIWADCGDITVTWATP